MRAEILKELEEKNYPSPSALGISKANRELKKKIFEATEFLGDETSTLFRAYCLINGIEEIPLCIECGNPVKRNLNSNSGTTVYDTYHFPDFCSRKCARTSKRTADRRKATIVDVYGDHNMRTERGQKEYTDALEAKYGEGVTSPMHIEGVIEKFINDDGVYLIATPEVRAKSKATKDGKYPDGIPMRCPEIAAKAIANRKMKMVERHGVEHESQINKNPIKLAEFHCDKAFTEIALRYDHAEDIAEYFDYHVSRVRSRLAELDLQKSSKTSRAEDQISEFLEGLGVRIQRNNRTLLGGREVDIYCPDHNLAIEFNGLFWHSEKFIKERKYHQDKSLRLRDIGVKLLTIWEDDWNTKRNLIERKMKYMLGMVSGGIGGRQCKIVKVGAKEADAFYNKHHIQGTVKCTSYGLMYNGELVACMGIRSTKSGMDLTRYATATNVRGGFTKLLRHIINTVKPDVVFTFASLDYSHGQLYEMNGFTDDGITPPNYIYYNNRKTYTLSRYQCMKHKLNDVVDNFDQSLTEHENMLKNGWFRVYDCGSIKYSMTL